MLERGEKTKDVNSKSKQNKRGKPKGDGEILQIIQGGEEICKERQSGNFE